MDLEMKKEVEQEIGCAISDDDFSRALAEARHKQDFLYGIEGKDYIKERWYLVVLTGGYVRQNALTDFTLDLSRTLHDMEKEHSFNKEQSALSDTHIVKASAL